MARTVKAEAIQKKIDDLQKKIAALQTKAERVNQAYDKAILKAEKNKAKEMKKIPYTFIQPFTDKEITVDAEEVERMYQEELRLAKCYLDFDMSCIKADNDDLTRKLKFAQDDLENLKQEEEDKPKLNPRLIQALKELVKEWTEQERKEMERTPSYKPYYTLMTEQDMMEYVVTPIAEEITYRCYPKIGEIDTFTKPMFWMGHVDSMTCTNKEGKSCLLSVSYVSPHTRTYISGKTAFVKAHVRLNTL